MRTLFLAAALGSLFTTAAAGPAREVISQAVRVANVPVPAFQNGYVFSLDGASVQLFAPEGYPAFVRVLQIPGATNPTARGLAVDSDGSVAVSVTYRTSTGFGAGIAFLDRHGIDTGFLNTDQYEPANLSYGEDHSLWTFGWQRDGSTRGFPDKQDYMMVRKYSPDRKESGRYLARSLFPKGLEPGSGSWQNLRIAATHDKIGLLAWSGEVSSQSEWVELNLNGTSIRRVPVNHVRYGELAFTSDGRLYRQMQRADKLTVLDENKPVWNDAGSSPGWTLMGADGSLLVFSNAGNGPIRLDWFGQPAIVAH